MNAGKYGLEKLRIPTLFIFISFGRSLEINKLSYLLKEGTTPQRPTTIHNNLQQSTTTRNDPQRLKIHSDPQQFTATHSDHKTIHSDSIKVVAFTLKRSQEPTQPLHFTDS